MVSEDFRIDDGSLAAEFGRILTAAIGATSLKL
jgi:hypothetical protein